MHVSIVLCTMYIEWVALKWKRRTREKQPRRTYRMPAILLVSSGPTGMMQLQSSMTVCSATVHISWILHFSTVTHSNGTLQYFHHRHRRRKHLKSGRVRSTVGLVRQQLGPTTSLKVQGNVSKRNEQKLLIRVVCRYRPVGRLLALPSELGLRASTLRMRRCASERARTVDMCVNGRRRRCYCAMSNNV